MDMRCVIAHSARAAAGITLIAMLTGCTATREEPYRTVERPAGGHQGSAADLVMNAPQLDEFAGYFDARSDDRLAVSGGPDWFSNVLWPEAPPPSLAESRRLSLPTRAESVIYFRPEGRGRYLFRYDRYRYYPVYDRR